MIGTAKKRRGRGRTPNDVYGWFQIKDDPEAGRTRGAIATELAREVGVPQSTLSRYFRRASSVGNNGAGCPRR